MKLILPFAALCCLIASTAKADCSQFSKPRPFAAVDVTKALAGMKAPQTTERATALKPDAAGGNSSIVGLWLTTFTSDGQVVDQGFDMWTSDGTEILNDTPPPATGNVCLGTWVKLPSNVYSLKHPSWTFDDAGNLTGTAIIRETVTLDKSGDTYQGNFTVDIYTLAGVAVQRFAGSIAATRITVD